MKMVKRFFSIILMTIYLLPGYGFAATDDFLNEKHLFSRFADTCDSFVADSGTVIEDVGDILEEVCIGGFHIPSNSFIPEYRLDLVGLVLFEVPLPSLEVYIPIFVPPQILV